MNSRILLVGDNPFHGISHLSQERAISRGKNLTDPKNASRLVNTALDNGADGFMFSVSNTTLSILKLACQDGQQSDIKLYAIVPYVFEFVRMAVTEGGFTGLAKKLGTDVVISANISAIYNGAQGVVANNPSSLLKAYLLYEESRIRRAAGKKGELSALFLHEVVTDMAISLNMEWLIRTHINHLLTRGVKPGLHTHNLPILVKTLKRWKIDIDKLAITTQFNSLGFGMTPSREAYEAAMREIPNAEVIAFGIMGSGYLKLADAFEYIDHLTQLSGLVIGVSSEKQARESFSYIKTKWNKPAETY